VLVLESLYLDLKDLPKLLGDAKIFKLGSFENRPIPCLARVRLLDGEDKNGFGDERRFFFTGLRPRSLSEDEDEDEEREREREIDPSSEDGDEESELPSPL
jgi:hypothetical protein